MDRDVQLIDGDIAAQPSVRSKYRGYLEFAGADFSNAARATVYLADINDFAAMNEVCPVMPVMRRRPGWPWKWPGCPYARIEIDAIAYVG